MERNPKWLLDYRNNRYSQTGEDGIIETILSTLPENDQWCVEFGAWDGLFLTNTRNLIESRKYSAVLIEADRSKFRSLQHNYASNQKVIPLNKRVGFHKNDSLDVILRNTPVPQNFDFLSIDIDGNDYHVWKALSDYRPKVVVIEYNPTIPTLVQFIQPADHSVTQGASIRSLVELGKEKGYELVCLLASNAFFVDKEYYPLFEIASNAPETLRTEHDAITYLFSGYDGTIFVRGHGRLPWHGIDIAESKLQQLPRYLRRHPNGYNWLQQRIFNFLYRPTGLKKLGAAVRQFTIQKEKGKMAEDDPRSGN